MLYRPEAFERLTDEAWDEGRVRDGIRSLVRGCEQAYDETDLWPVADDWDSYQARTPLTTLYAGASGVAWGLDQLRRRDHAETRLDLAGVARRSLELWRGLPDFPPRPEPPVHTDASLYFGETGVLVVAWRLGASAELADDLYERVRENADNETNELMHGAPGTMLAARALHVWTGEQRWADAWREAADVLWQRRDADGLWTYPPYGRGLGPSHGVVTNTNVLLQGGELLEPGRRDELTRDTAAVLARTAVVEDGRANWPIAAEDEGIVGFDGEIRLQWCHGGAGIVAGAAGYLDEELLLAAAELVWEAGPPAMTKGPGICHGTAGNGYAFLKVFEWTGDELWLERARRFAVHALGQVERWREERGRYRFSLWSGDVGAALFAADCLDARLIVPIVDGIEA